ncbi:dimethyl sulfoxide reductase anchor subunit family protein [Desulfosporosinus lacus]|uniref:Anaerobic dimethyl sulfoxide reductase subunit C (DMSO reductase anchor subunit) n=1 Tax=Desulfosporosinus lacus DSM 15449 TaxID=1121420 RepID=A0A1M6E8U5_9FIRM|nr:DmsC/YnfH family molybdoenzyme membrane anchor subunit [Desulfosporosinus lacus]SHI81882.1 anaerobic dimethyl sulfoxide reductase subunit C (DMSO reductase anchor subunit) [Desulfosporosinus lacus DSM 15449]
MFAEEWPLMMFTLISQLAIGSFIMLVLIRSMLAKKDASSAQRLTSFGFLAVGPIMALALLFSLFHLGTPMGAYRSILNLSSSWLSREILTAGLFFVLWFATYKVYQKENAGNALGWITALVGLLTIFSMASIYSNSIRPAWSNAHTFIAFFGATLVLGYAGAAALIGHIAKGQTLSAEAMAALKKVGYAAAVALIIPLIYLPVYFGNLNSGDAAAQASSMLLSGSYLIPLVLRWVLSLIGVMMLINVIFKQSKGAKILPANSILLAVALILVGEFIGRYVFYASAVSIMIG